MAHGTYLRKRTQGWAFRRAVPQDLQARFGLREIVRSLAHIAQSQAPYESRVLGFACEDLFMKARADEGLSTDDLQRFAKAVGASKVDKYQSWMTRKPPRDRKAAYEDYRDVAITACQAAAEGRSIFEPAHIEDLARKADIPQAVATAAMPLFQQVVARATGAYCIELAEHLRPRPSARSSVFQRMFGHPRDPEFEAAVEQFRRLGTLDIAPYLAAPREADASSRSDAVADEVTQAQAAPVVAEQRQGAGDPAGEGDAHATLDNGTPSSTHEKTRPRTNPPTPISEAGQIVDGSSKVTGSTAVGEIRFSTYWTSFVEEKIRLGEWSSSRRPELDGTLRLVRRLLGDVSLLTLSREQATLFRARFLCLPSDHKNMWIDRATGRERTYEELMIHVAELERTKSLKLVDAKTWNKQCGNCSAYLQYVKATSDAAKTIDNAFEQLSVSIAKTSAVVRLERAMAPTVALEALFETEVWRGRKRVYHLRGRGLLVVRDSLYWIPLMEVCLGLRREEAAQLRVKHITAKFKVLGIDLFASDIRVKTDEASRRWIPLSQTILDLGFIDCLVAGRDPDELLFPELSDDNAHQSFGDSFGRRFLNYVTLVDVDFSRAAAQNIDVSMLSNFEADALIEQEKQRLTAEFREKVSNHGVRHWFKTTAENTPGVKTLFVDEIMGHAGQQNSEGTNRYFKHVYVHNLKKTIDAIPMPFDPVALRRIAEQSERDHSFLLKARRGQH